MTGEGLLELLQELSSAQKKFDIRIEDGSRALHPVTKFEIWTSLTDDEHRIVLSIRGGE